MTNKNVFDIISIESEVREMTRKELIQNLDGIVTKHPKSDWSIYQRNIVDKAIKALNQEPKIGYWIKTGDYYTGAYGSIEYVKCSCCHEDSLEEGNYCPNCGAKMEGEIRE